MTVELGWSEIRARPIYRVQERYYDATTGLRLSSSDTLNPSFTLSQDDLSYAFLSGPVFIRDPSNGDCLVAAEDLYDNVRVMFSSANEPLEDMQAVDLLVPETFEEDRFISKQFGYHTSELYDFEHYSYYNLKWGPLCTLEMSVDNRPIYVINQEFRYDAVTLERTDVLTNDILMGDRPYIIESDTFEISKPVFINTTNGYYLMQADDDGYQILDHDTSDIIHERILSAIKIKLPRLEDIRMGVQRLPEDPGSFEFNQGKYDALLFGVENQLTFGEIVALPSWNQALNSRQISPPRLSPRRSPSPPPRTIVIPLPSPPRRSSSPPRRSSPSPPRSPKKYNPFKLKNSDLIDALIGRLYQVDVEIPPQIRNQMIGFERATELFQKNRIIKYLIDPSLQVWAGPIDSPNRIMTLFLDDGTTQLTKVRYYQLTNQIFPPI